MPAKFRGLVISLKVVSTNIRDLNLSPFQETLNTLKYNYLSKCNSENFSFLLVPCKIPQNHTFGTKFDT